MVDILKLGASSLLNMQRALSTTGNNIANVNTEGYSRQTVNFGTNISQEYGFGFIGQGSVITDITRAYNGFLTSQVQDFTSSQSRYQIFVGLTSRIDNILANSENNLSTAMQRFFGAAADVAANPSSLPERQVMLAQANNLVATQQGMNGLLQNLNDEVNSSLRLAVTEVNGLVESIGTLNKQIVSASASGTGATPNDLLDQRDRLVRQLAQKISVTTVEQSDGALNIFVGKGQALVVGNVTTKLQVGINASDSSRLEVGIAGQPASNLTSHFVSGGELQGLLDFRSRVLIPAQNQLGLISLGLTETINQLHQVGMDLNGDLGGAMFAPPSIPVVTGVANTGTSAPVVTLTDVTQLRASDYQVTYDGAQWHLTRKLDNTSVSGAGPLVLDGLSVDVSAGAPAAGDTFLFNPARTAASNFRLSITDPRKIAAASPVSLTTSAGNNGLASLTGLTVNTSGSLPLAGPVTLTFNPDALGVGVPGFDVVGGPGGTLAYDPLVEGGGKTFTLAGTGLSFTISNTPTAGDSFVISNNNSGTGDNSNMLRIGELQNQSLLNGGTNTYQEVYGSIVAQVASSSRQGEANLDLESALLQQAESYKDSVVGVNLDEEAANLLRYQQSYQAAAKLIQVADELFQTLINSVR